MKVKEAIEKLKTLDQNEEIIIAWWEKYDFPVSQQDWEQIIPIADTWFCWDATQQALACYIESFKDQ